MDAPRRGDVEVIDLLDSDSDDDSGAGEIATSQKRPALSPVSTNTLRGAIAPGGGNIFSKRAKRKRADDGVLKPAAGTGGTGVENCIGATAEVAAEASAYDSDVEIVEAPPSPSMKTGRVDDAANDKENVAATSPTAIATAASASGIRNAGKSVVDDDDDAEIALVGTKGQNALTDFPHSRENCVAHPFGGGDKRLRCPNCFCYVCDAPASTCQTWDEHCEASHGDPYWAGERERFRRQKELQAVTATNTNGLRVSASVSVATSAAVAAGVAAAVAANAASVNRATASSSSSSARPVAAMPSSSSAEGVPGSIRNQLARSNPDRHRNRPDLSQYSVRALLDALTSVHPVESEPPQSIFTTSLRHYQKQSLAFMLEVERSETSRFLKASLRGGWLCDEVGMGKSAVVLALVASNRLEMRRWPSAEMVRRRLLDRVPVAGNPGVGKRKLMRLKATVILTPVSLMGQWEDECRKHAPGLVVKAYHGSKKGNNAINFRSPTGHVDLAESDIIISTATFKWHSDIVDKFKFHRVIMDESHLFATAPASAKVWFAQSIPGNRRWCVTATPCTASVQELIKQSNFLGGAQGLNIFCQERMSKQRFYDIVDCLKPIMIRHTKSQRIGGSDALALPPSTTTTSLIDMNPRDQREAREAAAQDHILAKLKKSGGKAFPVCRALGLLGGFGRVTKVNVLRNHLQLLRQREPSLKAVVFTQHLGTQSLCAHFLGIAGFRVLQFSGSTCSNSRDKAIRQFQEDSSRPTVFVITMKAGNVGITLTAASRVFLLEPCLDPAVEVQCAGRIHRLGQNKPVEVTKYAFRNSVEENIINLHRRISAGRVLITDGFVTPEAVRILARGL